MQFRLRTLSFGRMFSIQKRIIEGILYGDSFSALMAYYRQCLLFGGHSSEGHSLRELVSMRLMHNIYTPPL